MEEEGGVLEEGVKARGVGRVSTILILLWTEQGGRGGATGADSVRNRWNGSLQPWELQGG